MKFAFFSGVLFLVAWVAGTGRVAYTLIMLLVGAALVFAVLGPGVTATSSSAGRPAS